MPVTFKIKKDFQNHVKEFHGSITELEKKSGFKKQQLSQTLSGKKEPTMNFLHRMCEITNVPVEKFVETVFK